MRNFSLQKKLSVIVDSPTSICFSVSLNPIFSSTHFWIVDSGATRHICSDANIFTTIRAIQNSAITLPKHTQIAVAFSGDIKLCAGLVLKDVLYVLQFKFNVLYVSALTRGSHLTVNFLPDCFVIQEINNKKMIGKGDKVEDLYVLDTTALNSQSTAYVNSVST